jgi:hypothetical protein
MAKILAFFSQNTAKLCKKLTTTWVLRKAPIFFRRKLAKMLKLVIITLAPGLRPLTLEAVDGVRHDDVLVGQLLVALLADEDGLAAPRQDLLQRVHAFLETKNQSLFWHVPRRHGGQCYSKYFWQYKTFVGSTHCIKCRQI